MIAASKNQNGPVDPNAEKVAKLRELFGHAMMGTENYHQHWLGRFVFTDGVYGMAEIAGAHWLIDAIASHQTRRAVRGNQMLQQFQVWQLKVDQKKSTAVLTCKADSGMGTVVRQRIPFTDFCLPEITLWVERGGFMGGDGRWVQSLVLMLKEER